MKKPKRVMSVKQALAILDEASRDGGINEVVAAAVVLTDLSNKLMTLIKLLNRLIGDR